MADPQDRSVEWAVESRGSISLSHTDTHDTHTENYVLQIIHLNENSDKGHY